MEAVLVTLVSLGVLAILGKWIISMLLSPKHPLSHSQYPELVQEVPRKQLFLRSPRSLPTQTETEAVPVLPALSTFRKEPEQILPDVAPKELLNQTGSALDLKRLEQERPREYLLVMQGILHQLARFYNLKHTLSRTQVVDTGHILGRTEWDYLIGSPQKPGLLRQLSIVGDVAKGNDVRTKFLAKGFTEIVAKWMQWYGTTHTTPEEREALKALDPLTYNGVMVAEGKSATEMVGGLSSVPSLTEEDEDEEGKDSDDE